MCVFACVCGRYVVENRERACTCVVLGFIYDFIQYFKGTLCSFHT